MGAGIGHHTVIGSHCLLSNPVLGGSVIVGQRTFIGMNAIIREKVNIENSNIIGAGTIILKDTLDNEVYSMASTPARPVSSDQIKLFK
jgi:UDP-3-O-[3-hydroxymyristoyl] glucosamine N-acyltransferase